MSATVQGLWALAAPLAAIGILWLMLREALKPPRHVNRLAARVAQIERQLAEDRARAARLDTVVRQVEQDLVAATQDVEPATPRRLEALARCRVGDTGQACQAANTGCPSDGVVAGCGWLPGGEPTERVPWDGWPHLKVGANKLEYHVPSAPEPPSWVDLHWADLDSRGVQLEQPTMELAAIRSRRPPSVLPPDPPPPIGITDALGQAGRPLTARQLAQVLDCDRWDLTGPLRDLWRAGTIRFATTHDADVAYELTGAHHQ